MHFTVTDLAIIFTLAYSDQFTFPLTKIELWRRLIQLPTSDKQLHPYSQKEFSRSIKSLLQQKIIFQSENFVYLAGRESSIRARQSRLTDFKQKQIQIQLLRKIMPWIIGAKAVFITGSTAIKNAKLDDDLDILVITSKNRLWIARLQLLVWSWLIGKKKSRLDEGKRGWCFNLWLDEAHLVINPKVRNVYQAFEVIQAKPIWGNVDSIAGFYQKNAWVEQYLPNGWPSISRKFTQKGSGFDRVPAHSFLDLLETIVYQVQLHYMQPHRTTEKIGTGFAFFHPRPTGQLVAAGWLRSIRRLKFAPELATIANSYAQSIFAPAAANSPTAK